MDNTAVMPRKLKNGDCRDVPRHGTAMTSTISNFGRVLVITAGWLVWRLWDGGHDLVALSGSVPKAYRLCLE
jgi:hypothetical protein